jgi:hypothetical protein
MHLYPFMILQRVSDPLAAATWCMFCGLVAQMCDAGQLCWHVPL